MAAAGDFETIRLEAADDDGVVVLRLARPERMNAFTVRMLDELLEALDAIDADDAVRAVVVTGEGRAFCAGADLEPGRPTFVREASGFSMAEHADEGGTLARRLQAATKPLVAAINGHAVGIGLTMTLSMDVRLVADEAKLGFVFARRGLVPEACSTYLLPRIVGHAQAAQWLFTGRTFGAGEALRAGLVQAVHPADDVLAAATDVAREMTRGTSAASVALTRQMLWAHTSADGGPELAHVVESRALHVLGTHGEAAEGVQAFLDKRPAAFRMSAAEAVGEVRRSSSAHLGRRADVSPLRSSSLRAPGGPGRQSRA